MKGIVSTYDFTINNLAKRQALFGVPNIVDGEPSNWMGLDLVVLREYVCTKYAEKHARYRRVGTFAYQNSINCLVDQLVIAKLYEQVDLLST